MTEVQIDAASVKKRRARIDRQPVPLALILSSPSTAVVALVVLALVVGAFYVGYERGLQAQADVVERLQDELEVTARLAERDAEPASKERARRAPQPRVATQVAKAVPVSSGTATVSARPAVAAAAERPPADVPRLRDDPPAGRYGIQVGAFKTLQEAREFVALHREAFRRLPVFVVSVNIPQKGVWHRVRVGALRSRRSATRLKSRLGPGVGAEALVVPYR